jgi:hypothetical protein
MRVVLPLLLLLCVALAWCVSGVDATVRPAAGPSRITQCKRMRIGKEGKGVRVSVLSAHAWPPSLPLHRSQLAWCHCQHAGCLQTSDCSRIFKTDAGLTKGPRSLLTLLYCWCCYCCSVQWVDITSATTGGVSPGGGAGVLLNVTAGSVRKTLSLKLTATAGSVLAPSTSTIGSALACNPNNLRCYWTAAQASTQNLAPWDSAAISNPIRPCDIFMLKDGTSLSTYTIAFTEGSTPSNTPSAVTDIYIPITGLGKPEVEGTPAQLASMDFGSVPVRLVTPYSIDEPGPIYRSPLFESGSFSALSVTGNVVSGIGGAGIILIPGSRSSLTFTVPTGELFGFTVGFRTLTAFEPLCPDAYPAGMPTNDIIVSRSDDLNVGSVSTFVASCGGGQVSSAPVTSTCRASATGPSTWEPVTTYPQCVSTAVDCVVSQWQNEGTCAGTCGVGQQTQTRKILTPSVGNGVQCPPASELTKTVPCQLSACTCGATSTYPSLVQLASTPTPVPANVDASVSFKRVDCGGQSNRHA